jgi:hypothetical protein
MRDRIKAIILYAEHKERKFSATGQLSIMLCVLTVVFMVIGLIVTNEATREPQPIKQVALFDSSQAIILIQNGTWTAHVYDQFGTTFQSGNLTEVVEWAKNQTKVNTP